MKTIATLVCIFIVNYVFSQYEEDYKSGKPIKTGYVFIDGKYIEPPYRVKRKGLAVYINGIQVTKELDDGINLHVRCDERVGIPHCINKLSTIEDWRTCKVPGKEFSYLAAMSSYFLVKYPYQQSLDSLTEYYKSLPNVEKMEKLSTTMWEITLYNGYKFKTFFGGGMYAKRSQKFGPNGTGPVPVKELEKRVDLKIENRFEAPLLSNDILIIDKVDYTQFTIPTNLHNIFHFNLLLNNNEIAIGQKIDSLKHFFIGNRIMAKEFITKYKFSEEFQKRLKKLEDSKIEKKVKGKETNYIPENNFNDINPHNSKKFMEKWLSVFFGINFYKLQLWNLNLTA